MRLHFTEVGDVADVVAFPVLFRIRVVHRLAGDAGYPVEGFQDGGGVVAPTANVIDLPATGSAEELLDEARHVVRMNIIADLLAFIPKDSVLTTRNIDADEVAQKTVELYSGVIGAGKAPAAQGAGRHPEVPAVLLYHYVGGHLGGSEKRVFRLVNGEGLLDAILVGGIAIVPTGVGFHKLKPVGGISVDLVGTHVGKRAGGAKLPGGLQQIEGAYRIDVKIIEGARSSQIVGRLSGGVGDVRRAQLFEEFQHPLAVADVELDVLKVLALLQQLALIPAGIPPGTEEISPHIIVDSVNPPAKCVKMTDDFRADESGGAGDQ